MTAKKMEELVSLCKRRGFIYQTNELYGGMQGVYDYGPLGVELKNNLKQAWWSSMVYERDDIEERLLNSLKPLCEHLVHFGSYPNNVID